MAYAAKSQTPRSQISIMGGIEEVFELQEPTIRYCPDTSSFTSSQAKMVMGTRSGTIPRQNQAQQNQAQQQDQAQMLKQLKDNEELQSAITRLGIRSIAYPRRLFDIRPDPANLAKGLGWFATVNIQRGTPLLAEEALFEVFGARAATIDAERNKLSPSDQIEFDALAGPNVNSSHKEKFDRNAFGLSVTKKDGKRNGIFLVASRINHSCRPNAYWTWNRLLSRLTVNAMAAIPMGGEITVSYDRIIEYPTRERRNAKLFKRYGFRCECELCLPQSVLGADSEARRDAMRELKKKIDADKYHRHDLQKLQDLGELEDLVRQEDLIYPVLAEIWNSGAEWYRETLSDIGTGVATYANGHRLMALEFARKELDLVVACEGHESSEVKKTLKFIRQLKAS